MRVFDGVLMVFEGFDGFLRVFEGFG